MTIKALREGLRSPAFSGYAYGRQVHGYHGGDQEVARRILAGESFRPATNPWDWLGDGIYFWEYGPDRAYRWAANRDGGGHPAVVGAVIQLGRCFDLLDTRFTMQLRRFHASWHWTLEAEQLDVPENRGKARYLDRAVIEAFMKLAEERGTPYDTVRAAFIEGDPVFPGSGIHMETHIQVAVRNPDAIVGVFQPMTSSSGGTGDE